MPKENMKMSIEEIKNAMLNPDLISHLNGLKISNRWGDIDGKQLMIDVYRLCEKHEELLRSASNDTRENLIG